jgi:hypothetical protein
MATGQNYDFNENGIHRISKTFHFAPALALTIGW